MRRNFLDVNSFWVDFCPKKFLQACVGGDVAVVIVIIVVVVIVVLFVPFEASPEQFWCPELLGGFLGAPEINLSTFRWID